MTYNREFYTIFVVDTRSIRYFCGRKPNDIETDEDKEAVIFSLTGPPCTDKPVFLQRRPLERILSADRARPVDGQPGEQQGAVDLRPQCPDCHACRVCLSAVFRAGNGRGNPRKQIRRKPL